MKAIKKTTDRRKFLLAAGLGTAGVAAAVAARVPKAGDKVAAADVAQPDGYRASAPVRKYYKTTEV